MTKPNLNTCKVVRFPAAGPSTADPPSKMEKKVSSAHKYHDLCNVALTHENEEMQQGGGLNSSVFQYVGIPSLSISGWQETGLEDAEIQTRPFSRQDGVKEISACGNAIFSKEELWELATFFGYLSVLGFPAGKLVKATLPDPCLLRSPNKTQVKLMWPDIITIIIIYLPLEKTEPKRENIRSHAAQDVTHHKIFNLLLQMIVGPTEMTQIKKRLIVKVYVSHSWNKLKGSFLSNVELLCINN